MPTENTPLKGRLRISRPSGGRHDDAEVISLTLTDDLSGVAFLNVEVPLADMMRALTSAEAPCDFTLRWVERVGMVRQVKTVSVYVTGTYLTRDEALVNARAACAPYEEDGWRAHYEDACNHHRRTGGDAEGSTYGVTFVRFVPVDAPQTIPNDEPF